MSSRSGGPRWTRERGYHTPAPTPAHIMRIITRPASAMSPGTAETRSGSGPQDGQRGGEAEAPKSPLITPTTED
jgi:hypothetical protein